MVFKKYKYGAWKQEIRDLLRKRFKLRDKINFHKKKIAFHEEKMEVVEKETLPALEKELDNYLKKAGN